MTPDKVSCRPLNCHGLKSCQPELFKHIELSTCGTGLVAVSLYWRPAVNQGHWADCGRRRLENEAHSCPVLQL